MVGQQLGNRCLERPEECRRDWLLRRDRGLHLLNVREYELLFLEHMGIQFLRYRREQFFDG